MQDHTKVALNARGYSVADQIFCEFPWCTKLSW
jgi:hypothetical protein